MTPYTTTPVVISADEPDEGEMQAVAVMTLRDVFAAKAMQGMLAGHFACYGHDNYWKREAIADEAYEMADAMLKERKQ